jgi:hypothetical protein
LPCGHFGGYAVAGSIVVLFTVGACGFCHLSSPVGGAAHRILMIVSLLIRGEIYVVDTWIEETWWSNVPFKYI